MFSSMVVHLFENCASSPAFPSFQEGLYHVLEVAREHPAFATTLLHEVIDQGNEDKTGDWSYAAVSLFDPVEESAGAHMGESLWAQDDTYHTACEFGVKEPNYEAVLGEVACLPEGTDSPLAPGAAAKTSDQDAVLLAIYSESFTGPLAVKLAEQVQEKLPNVRSVCLYKGEGGFACCLRAELTGPLDFDLVESCRVDFATIAESAPGLVHSGVYRVLFECPKNGPTVGLVAAQKATDLANKAGLSALGDA